LYHDFESLQKTTTSKTFKRLIDFPSGFPVIAMEKRDK
jgi:hypothetical protein